VKKTGKSATNLLLRLGKLEHEVLSAAASVLSREEAFHVSAVSVGTGGDDTGRGGKAGGEGD
jgi:hypothetical protein